MISVLPRIRLFRRLALAWSMLGMGVLGGSIQAQEEAGEKVRFSIPAGEATQSLMLAAAQAEVDIMFVPKTTAGVTTHPVEGDYALSEALDLLLRDTPLVAVRDSSGAYAVIEPARKGGNLSSRTDNPSLNQNNKLPSNQETPMKEKKQTAGTFIKGLLSLAIAGSPSLSAQDDSENEVYELSPFTVDGSEDTGYRATSTLAGTRIKTNLKDLGSAISVITEEFMDDTAATDASTLLSYTTNTEVGGYQGNFSGASPDEDNGGRYLQSGERTNPQFNQRIRGLGRADLTRGFFLTDIPFDSYNTNRVTVSRGPNSLLFGIGSPGGVINNNVKQPIQNSNFGEAKVRLDNYGSMRTELDVNRSLVENRLALRISALHDDAKYKQEPTSNLDRRFYGALDVVLFKNENSEFMDSTRFRFNTELGESEGSPVEIIPPSVAYHGWFEPISANIQQFSGIAPTSRVISPSEGGSWEFQTTYNPLLSNAEGQINTNTHPSWFRWIAAVWDDPTSAAPNLGTGDGIQGYQSLLTWNANLDTLASTGLAGTPAAIAAFGPDAPGDTAVNRTVDYHTNSPYSEPYAIGFAIPTIQNTNVFDYRNKIYSGGVDRVERQFDVQNFALEQSFFDNKLALEVAYDKQHYESDQDFLFAGSGGTSTTGPYDLYVSIMEYLPNGQPNPNLGRAYTRLGRPETRFSETDRETFRFTAFGEYDFREKDGWLSHLGRHRLTGLYNDHTRDTHSINMRESWVSNEFDIRSAVQGPGLNSARSTASYVVFTSDSLLGVQSMDDVRINQINIKRPQPGDSYNVIYTDTSSAGADRTLRTGAVQVERWMNNEGISQTNIEAKAFALQSYLFNEHIVGLFGYREDDTENFSRATESEVGFDDRDSLGRWNPDFTRLSATPSLVETGDTTTWSLVGRYPEDLLGELPWGMDLQVHYAESENFNPVGLRNNALGQAIGQPTGTTEEYGFLVSFAENKYTLKANWFKTALNDVDAGVSVNVGSEAYGRINNYRDADINGRTFDNQLVTVDGDPAAFPIQDYDTFYAAMLNAVPPEFRAITNPRQEDSDGDGIWDQIEWDNIPALRSTQDRVADGFELELVASPTTGWRILANISQQETIQSDTASVMAAVVEGFTANLFSSRLGELRRDASGTVQTRPIDEVWLSESVAPIRGAKALDNTVSNEQREWRYTVVSSYQFTEGKFNGFTVGGAGRWESKAATGYVFGLDPDTNVPIPLINQPFFDDGLFSADLWLGYGRKIRNETIDWKVQLNVRNAFGDNDDIPVKTNPDGQVAIIRIPNPRTIYLTNSFKF